MHVMFFFNKIRKVIFIKNFNDKDPLCNTFRKEKGFTLIEIMVAIFFITIAIISLTSLTIGSVVLHDNVEQRGKASNTAVMLLNEYSADPFNLPAATLTGLPAKNGFNWTLTPTVINATETMLSVNITWKTRLNKTKALTVNRLVSSAVGTP